MIRSEEKPQFTTGIGATSDIRTTDPPTTTATTTTTRMSTATKSYTAMKIEHADPNDDECSICLEAMEERAPRGRAPCCERFYHHTCILKWSEASNSCPTCRKRFHSVLVYNKETPQLSTMVPVKDKLLPVESVIPPEFIIPANSIPVREPSAAVERCCLCSEVSRGGTTCTVCVSHYHTACLGVIGDYWCCPMCDSEQDAPQLPQPRTKRTIRSVRASPSKNSGRLVIRNDHDEIDDDFLYSGEQDLDPNTSWVSTGRINGGALIRREQRARQLLTADELKSWEAFDSKAEPPIESSDNIAESSSKRRRRKKISPVDVPATLDVSTSGGRISNLISQLKSSQQSAQYIPQQQVTVTSISPSYSPSNSRSHSPCGAPSGAWPSGSYSGSGSGSGSGSASPSSPQSSPDKPELTLTQKSAVQRIVRDRLKPLYTTSIQTEQDFIGINKHISRKIYSVILNRCISNGELDQQLLEDLFNSGLQQVIDEHVERELKKMKRRRSTSDNRSDQNP